MGNHILHIAQRGEDLPANGIVLIGGLNIHQMQIIGSHSEWHMVFQGQLYGFFMARLQLDQAFNALQSPQIFEDVSELPVPVLPIILARAQVIQYSPSVFVSLGGYPGIKPGVVSF